MHDWSELQRNLAYADKMGGSIQFDSAANTQVSHLIIPANLKRRALIISSPISNRVTLTFSPPAVDGNGFVIPSANIPLILTRELIGDAIYKPWYGIAGGGPAFIGWIEVNEPTECYKDTPRTTGVVGPWQGHS